VGDLLLELAAEQGVMLLCVTHSAELASRFPQRYQLKTGRLETVPTGMSGTGVSLSS
jgi:lipoprotein-releasing system ATP-binding protein